MEMLGERSEEYVHRNVWGRSFQEEGPDTANKLLKEQVMFRA